MERILSQEERIKRAEEIYYRRKLNNNNVRMPSSQVKDNTEKRQFSLYKKMVIQMLFCILIYLCFSLIKQANYLFSEDLIGKTKEFLSHDINFETIMSGVGELWQNNKEKFNIFVNENDEENTEDINNETQNNEQTNTQGNEQTENVENSEQIENTKSDENLQINEINDETTGIGGASFKEETVTQLSKDSNKKTQMELDAEYIKTNFSLKLPVKAKITSHYGKREPTEIVSENHYGIDLGVAVGTEVKAAMAGTVSVVSDEGEYGTHIKIENKDVTTIYAHCSKILVKEGTKIKLGQKIALSGNTGKTTGPHLHFEIRRDTRTIDPELVLNWG